MGELEPKRVRADAAQRAQRAAEMRVAGATWRQIAETVGYAAESGARRAVENHFGSLPAPDRAAAKAMMRERSEHLWQQSVQDVAEQKPGAVRASIALLQRQSQLDGLDEPTRMQVSADAAEFERVVSLMVAARRQELGYDDAVEADIWDESSVVEVEVEVDVIE